MVNRLRVIKRNFFSPSTLEKAKSQGLAQVSHWTGPKVMDLSNQAMNDFWAVCEIKECHERFQDFGFDKDKCVHVWLWWSEVSCPPPRTFYSDFSSISPSSFFSFCCSNTVFYLFIFCIPLLPHSSTSFWCIYSWK